MALTFLAKARPTPRRRGGGSPRAADGSRSALLQEIGQLKLRLLLPAGNTSVSEEDGGGCGSATPGSREELQSRLESLLAEHARLPRQPAPTPSTCSAVPLGGADRSSCSSLQQLARSAAAYQSGAGAGTGEYPPAIGTAGVVMAPPGDTATNSAGCG